MVLEPLGVLFLMAGIACLLRGDAFGVFVLTISTLLGAAAALFLTSVGNANIQPAHLLLCFLGIDLVIRRSALSSAFENLTFPRAGFWLLLTVSYGAILTIFMPRLFEGVTYVFNLAQTGSGGASIVLNPLRPVSANFTQMIYLVGGLICFLVFCAYARNEEKLDSIAKAVISCAFINVAFAILDIATYFTDTPHLLDLIRNSSYRILDDVELAGVKRIVGSFAEASAFAYATIGLFGFTFELWLKGLYRPYAGTSASLSLLVLLASTSSAGYLGAAGYLCWQYLRCVIQIAQRRAAPNAIRFVLIGPILLGIGVCISLLTPSIGDFVRGIFEISITNKLVSGSGIERASWNGQAMNVFFDTYWMGAGIGSVRASSWPIAVLASVGIAGAVMYGMFIARILCARAPALADRERGIVSAARALCVAQLITSTVAVSFMDLGLMFFGLAGVVCGSIAPRHVASEDRVMNDGTEIMGTNVERSR